MKYSAKNWSIENRVVHFPQLYNKVDPLSNSFYNYSSNVATVV